MRESQIENYLVRRVKELGGEVRKVKWIGRRGAPDRVVMLPPVASVANASGVSRFPRTLWIELKAPGEKAKPHQAREHERMRAMGQVVVVVDSMDGVDEALL
ncbi:VRR-NUC domain-containing protein [Bordetella hinzii]|uniref:VRR-NUC domain-containing protein n=1 Tax=Bordetella hinzii TaxID=103855 RepID=UPI0013EFD7EA|nr:VRR-NUC domain-containing protein [Bordetella hinzii]QII84203.1 VRR-NUC domain-containing protein [Bordetella hinzii]